MENASKALLMAGAVLIGVIILSLAVYMFSTFGGYSSSIYSKIEEAQINQFNSKFLQYTGTRGKDDGTTEPILCTIHDIMTIANLAQKNNIEHELNGQTSIGDNPNYEYIQIDLVKYNLPNRYIRKNMETMNDDAQIQFIKDNSLYEYEETQPDGTTKKKQKTKYYMCRSENVKISEITKKVYYMKFEEAERYN